jgi:hypothetical protein
MPRGVDTFLTCLPRKIGRVAGGRLRSVVLVFIRQVRPVAAFDAIDLAGEAERLIGEFDGHGFAILVALDLPLGVGAVAIGAVANWSETPGSWNAGRVFERAT